ncbi:hypothetical protein PF438_04105 [Elizabethkingia meningoseptica]|uniref:hypothetical protein n=1 Tax=Elizabethkingia TaxID=308865 RepID=UPI0009993C61|nr:MULTISPECIES: hypothetical protein [Elizabethkingia]EJK5330543.1 hypothetical protein [Elizabethkingia meningoseptica]MCT3673301.1 hypothetical protein [Elizabethkingia anophelis]MCT3680141.1 hypothetical protein [Elizabethkingia anophelis]MCT4253691.1 hypothetical protein [Elizabethkingia anophelis]OPC51490.1 hypothetical protein BAY06_03950 [Elizabethkingia anophelis]
MDFFKTYFSKFYDEKFIEFNSNLDAQGFVRDIKKTSNDGPFIDVDIALLINSILKDRIIQDEELEEYVRIACSGIRKGNKDEVLKQLMKLRNK